MIVRRRQRGMPRYTEKRKGEMNRTVFAVALIALGGPAIAGEWMKGYSRRDGTYFAPYHRLESGNRQDRSRGIKDSVANQQAAGPHAALQGHEGEAFNDAFPGARLQSPYRNNRSVPYSWWK